MSFLKRRYIEDSMPMKDLTNLMYQIALHTDCYLYEPWHTMYLMGDLFVEAEDGYINKEDYQRKFDAFLNDGVCFCDHPSVLPKESFLKKLIKKIFSNQ